MGAYKRIAEATVDLGHILSNQGGIAACTCGYTGPAFSISACRAHRVQAWADWAEATELIPVGGAPVAQRLLPGFTGTYEQLLTVANGTAA